MTYESERLLFIKGHLTNTIHVFKAGETNLGNDRDERAFKILTLLILRILKFNRLAIVQTS